MATPRPTKESGRSGDLVELRKLARYRRTKHTSSDRSGAREFLVSSVKFRVAAPPAWPCPLVNRWTDDCELIRRALGNGLEREVNSVLLANGVDVVEQCGPYATDLIFRAVEGDDTRGQPTVLVVATWDDSTSPVVWDRAVKEAKRFIDANALAHGLHHVDIAVEVIAKELTRELYVSHVPECELTSGLAQDWDCIKDNVGRILATNEVTEGKVSTISLFRLGSSVKPDANPLTVYVSVDYESNEGDWPPIIDQIQHYLSGYPYNLQLHIEHGSPLTYPTLDLLSKPMTAEEQGRKQGLNISLEGTYQTTVGLGEDIGPRCYITKNGSGGEKVIPGVGTLGCWVEIKTQNEGWARYALTSYHVIRPALEGFRLVVDSKSGAVAAPAEGSDLWKADHDGIFSATAWAALPEMEHPTKAKHYFTVEWWGREIDRSGPLHRNPDDEKYLADITAFFDDGNQRFGTVYAASGYARRTPSNGRLDWALIKPLEGRIGNNTIPERGEWLGATVQMPLWGVLGTNLGQPTGLPAMPHGELLYKKGAATGPTAGICSALRSSVRLRDDAHLGVGRERDSSDEFLCIACPGAGWFAKDGDSGSVLFDERGSPVGFLFRAQKAQPAANTWAYITPIRDVLADIKKFSQGEIIDIRIAEH